MDRPLLRVVGVAFGVAIVIGGTIGTGVLRLPQEIAAGVGDGGWYLAVWIAGGAYALVCAPSFAELGAMSTRSGGLYVFVRRGLGEGAGLVVGTSDWVSFGGTIAAMALFVGEMVDRLGAGTGAMPIAIAVIVVFTAVQLAGLRAGSWVQIASSGLKAAVLVALAAAALFHDAAPAVTAHVPSAPTGWARLLAFAVAMKAIVFVYDGYYHAAYFAGELKDPGKDVPRSIFTTLAIVIAIYLALNLAYLHVLGLAGVARESFTGGAFAGALFGDAGDRVITAVVLVTLVSGLQENFLAAPRILHAMAGDGLLPGALSLVSRGGTPIVPLVLTGAASLAFALTGTFERALAVVFFNVLVNYALAFASVFALRLREPDAPRPYRARGYPVTTALALAIIVALLVASIFDDPISAAICASTIAAVLLLFVGSRRSARDRAARSEEPRQQGSGKGSEPERSTDREDEEGAR